MLKGQSAHQLQKQQKKGFTAKLTPLPFLPLQSRTLAF